MIPLFSILYDPLPNPLFLLPRVFERLAPCGVPGAVFSFPDIKNENRNIFPIYAYNLFLLTRMTSTFVPDDCIFRYSPCLSPFLLLDWCILRNSGQIYLFARQDTESSAFADLLCSGRHHSFKVSIMLSFILPSLVRIPRVRSMAFPP